MKLNIRTLVEIFLWIFRRNEKDVINYYNSNSDILRLIAGGNMLCYGYWNDETNSPLSAQKNLCTIFGKMAQLGSGQKVVDVGSGLASPALQWYTDYHPIEITCVELNYKLLENSLKNIAKSFDNTQKTKNHLEENFNLLNATGTILPFANESVDRVLALQSASHFKPLQNFFSESYRILKKDGILSMGISVVDKKYTSIMKFGFFSLSWSAERYSTDFIESLLKQEGFHILEQKKTGSNTYEPFATYYIKNRDSIKPKIIERYSSYTEKLLFKTLNTLKDISQKKMIDHLLITCQKE